MSSSSSKTTGLVGSWADTVGSVAPGTVTLLDRSRWKNNGTFPGGGNNPTWSRLPSGLWVLNFDGVNDYIQIPHSASLAITGAITLMCWVKPTRLVSVATISDGLITKGAAVSAYNLFAGDSDRITGRITSLGAAKTIAANNVFSVGNWYFAVMTYNLATEYLYLNGIQQTATSVFATGIDANAQPLEIGHWFGDDTRSFQGLIGLVRIFSYALTPAAIRNLFARERGYFGV